MKFQWEKKYAQIAFWVCLIILFTVVCIFFFWNYNDFGTYIKAIIKVLNPIIYGIVIAYVLNKIMKLYENKVFVFLDRKPGRMRLKRRFSLFSTYITAIALLAGFIWLIVPQVMAGIKDLRTQIPNYIIDIEAWLYEVADINSFFYEIIMKGIDYIEDLYGRLDEIVATIMPKITDWLSNIVTFLKDLAIGIILSVYFLVQKEKFLAQGKRFACAILSEKKYDGFIKVMKDVDNSFGGYLVAMGVDSFLVMIECLVLFGFAKIPYYPLISVIVGVTNFIPFFGPFIGAIPSAIIIFIVDPLDVIPFALLVLLIQQVDGNIIAPKIIGSHIGISSVWVVIAITVMSGFFGFIGMIIGVPLFSVIYTLIDNALANKLEKKNCDTEIMDFYSDDNLMGRTMEIEMMEKELLRAQRVPLKKRFKDWFGRVILKKSSGDDDDEDGEVRVKEFTDEILYDAFYETPKISDDENLDSEEFFETEESEFPKEYIAEEVKEDIE